MRRCPITSPLFSTAFFLFLVLGSSFTALSQQPLTVRGKTMDDKGSPLSGVSIIVKGSSRATVSDDRGIFEIVVAQVPAVLLSTNVGYQSVETVINGASEITITLKAVSAQLNDVVVIGYGTQRRVDVTGAIGSVTSKDIRNLPVRSAQEALQGKVAGVQVTQSSGSPGSLGVVRIRGVGSINGSGEPLYVVDGLPQSSVSWLNPNDIQSMDVLKDASAAAIYGSRASNGVVMITTKKGSLNDDMHVTFDSYTGIQSAWKRPHMLDASEFIEYKTRAAAAAGTTASLPVELTTPAGIDQVLQFVKDNTGSTAGTDWWKQVVNSNALSQSYNIGVSGGNKKLSLGSTLGYMKQQGLVSGSDYTRISWHNNMDMVVSSRIRFSSNFNVVYEKRRNIDENNPYTGTIFNAMVSDPITPVYRDHLTNVPAFYNRIMTGYEADNPFSKYAGVLYSNKNNPVAQIERMRQSQYSSLGLKGGAALDVKIIDPLSFRSSFGADLSGGLSQGFLPSYYLTAFDQAAANTVSNADSYVNYFAWTNTLTFDKTWNDHHLTVLGGVSAELTKGLTNTASRQGIPNNNEDQRIIDAATGNQTVTGRTYSSSLNSYFGRVNYVFANKYIIAGTIRRDGTSNFGNGHKWGTFPSVSAAWRLTQESFIKNAGLDWLDDAKLRGSYGLIGNQNVLAGSYLSTYGRTGYYYFGDASTAVMTGGRTAVGTADLQWETSKQTDLGLDLSLLKGRWVISADYFNKKVEQLLLIVPLPSTLGYPNSPYSNAGTMQNRGWELSVTNNNNIGELKVGVTANISFVRNKVLSLGGGQAVGGYAHLNELMTRTEEGQPVGYYFGYQTDGIFQTQADVDKSPQKGLSTPGDLRFKDINGTDAAGNVTKGADGILNDADRTKIGNPWPKYTYGLTLNLSYRQFDLSAFFQGIQGNDVMDILRYDTESGTGYYNAPKGFLQKAWNGEGTSNTNYKISTNAGLNTKISSHFVENGSYMRLKNIQLGYNFPEALLKTMHIPSLRFYVAAQNLFTVTKYTGLDPEIGSTDPKLMGIDQGYYPQTRSFMLGLNVKF
jgi:TonB-linked SusC/RagA family outer membrane protein